MEVFYGSYLHIVSVATCQGKTTFSPGQGIVRKFLKKKCQEIWPMYPCRGSVKEFCHGN